MEDNPNISFIFVSSKSLKIMKTISKSKTSQMEAGINHLTVDIKITNPVYDVAPKYLMEDHAVVKFHPKKWKYILKNIFQNAMKLHSGYLILPRIL